MRQVYDDAWEKTGFRKTQKKTCAVKLHRRMDHGNQNGDQSPGNQDAGNPLPGAPTLHDQRARNLKKEVASEKNARTQAEYALRETQVVGHLEARKTHINAIQVCNKIKNEEKRQIG